MSSTWWIREEQGSNYDESCVDCYPGNIRIVCNIPHDRPGKYAQAAHGTHLVCTCYGSPSSNRGHNIIFLSVKLWTPLELAPIKFRCGGVETKRRREYLWLHDGRTRQTYSRLESESEPVCIRELAAASAVAVSNGSSLLIYPNIPTLSILRVSPTNVHHFRTPELIRRQIYIVSTIHREIANCINSYPGSVVRPNGDAFQSSTRYNRSLSGRRIRQ